MKALQKPPRLDDVKRELSRRSLKHFVKAAWPHMEPGVPFLDNWHIDAMCEHLTALYKRQIKRLIINVPPRTSKSSLASVAFPAWVWLTDPGYKFITTSYERSLAVRDAIRSRRLFDTDWYMNLNSVPGAFGKREPGFRMFDADVKGAQRLKDVEDYYENNKGGHRIAKGVKGALTGQGCNLAACDDPHDPRRAYSEAERIACLSWWDETVSTRLNNMAEDCKLIIMQRLHVFDLTGHELAKDLGYVHCKLPMEFRPERRCVTSLGIGDDGVEVKWQDPRTLDNELLWPARFDKPALDTLKKSLGPFGYASQEQQDPIPEGGGIFKPSWFARWENLPIFDLVMLSVDSSFGGKKEENSFVCLQVWGFKGPKAYLLDQVLEHFSYPDAKQAIRDLRIKWAEMGNMPTQIIIEAKANGTALIQELSLEIPGLEGINPTEGKESRAHAVAPFCASGNVLIPADAPWVGHFLFEAGNFPKAGHDDQVDSLSQALYVRYLRNVEVDTQRVRSSFMKWSKMKVPGQC